MKEDVEGDKRGEDIYTFYIDGYISGYNLAREGKMDFTDETKGISNFKYVLKYCENNPIESVGNAINKLILEFNENLY